MRRALLVAAAGLVLVIAGGWLFVRHTLGSDLIRTTLEQQLSARLGQPVHIGAASASLFPAVGVDLHQVTVGVPPVIALERVELQTGIRALFSRRIAHAAVVLADGRLPFPLPFPVGPGGGSGTPTAGPLTITSIDRIALRNVTIATGLPPVAIDLDASLQGDRLEIERLTARDGSTALAARGQFESLSRLRGHLEVTGDLEAAGYRARDLTATVEIAPDRLTLSPLSFAIFGGTYKGRLEADLHGQAPRIALDGDVAGIDVPQLLEHSGSAGGITGTLGGHLAVSASGADGATLLGTARGPITARVVDGTLPHLDLVRAVVLAFGKPNGAPPAGSGSTFSALGGPLRLANRSLSSDSLVLNSRDFDMQISGSLALDSGAVDARGDLVLSRELTAQAGTDLRRYAQQDGRVIVPVTVSGTLTAPSVFVDLAAATRRALTNEVKRRLDDLLGGLFKKKKGGG